MPQPFRGRCTLPKPPITECRERKGIGAEPHCDGQVLVVHDLEGLFERFTPKFVKRYANVTEGIREAVAAYKDEVESGAFPAKEHEFGS